MLIVCPSCASEYRIDPTRLGASGQRVRCASCRDTWFVLPPDAGQDRAGPTALGTVRDDRSFSLAAPGSKPRRQPLRVAAQAAKPRLRASRLVVASAALVVLAVPPALAFRDRVVAALPRSAVLFAAIRIPVNLTGVAVSQVTAAKSESDGTRILVIEGRIDNEAQRAAPLPRLDLTIEGASGEQLYRWTAKPPKAELAASESAPFRLRLASPPPDGQRVVVGFERPGPSAAIAMR